MSERAEPRVHGERRYRLATARNAIARNARRPAPAPRVDPDERDPSSRSYRLTLEEAEAELDYMREATAIEHFDQLERHADHASWSAEPSWSRLPRCPGCGAHIETDICQLCGGPQP